MADSRVNAISEREDSRCIYGQLLKYFKKKSLIIFFTYGYSLKRWEKAGIISREAKYYNELNKYFRRVYLLTYGDLDELKYRRYLNKSVKVLFNYLRLPSLLYSLLAPIIYRRIFKNASIYRTHQVWGSWTAIMAKLLYRKKLVLRQGYQYSALLERLNARLIRRFFVRLLEFFAYLIADRIIVTSPSDKEYIVKKYHVTPFKITIIPNYIDTNLFRPLNNVVKNSDRIVFVGRLSYEKNLFSLLDAVKGLGIKLIVIGDGPLRDILEEKVKNENINNVEFVGIIPNEKLSLILNTCKIFILPSFYDGNPKALLEAMACGLPVIGANVPNINRIIRHGENGYLCGTDKESISKAIKTLLSNKKLRKKLGCNAREYVERNYSLQEVLKSERKIYLELINVD